MDMLGYNDSRFQDEIDLHEFHLYMERQRREQEENRSAGDETPMEETKLGPEPVAQTAEQV